MEYQIKCGCKVIESPPNFAIKYCPMHKSAPDMYEALKAISEQFRRSHIGIGIALSQKIKAGEKALAKAEGKEIICK